MKTQKAWAICYLNPSSPGGSGFVCFDKPIFHLHNREVPQPLAVYDTKEDAEEAMRLALAHIDDPATRTRWAVCEVTVTLERVLGENDEGH